MKKANLVIVESPAKAKTIQKYLGDRFVVRSCMGHIKDLPKSKMGIDVEKGFKPHYIIIPQKRKVVNALKKDIKNKDNLYLASDYDREGEAISWHLQNVLGEGKNVYRVVFHEITKDAIQEAFKNPKELDLNKVDSQQARRVLDRVVGYNLSPLLWKKVGKGLSAGRVQSVALRLIVEREQEIKDFITQEYWQVEAELKKLDTGETIKAALVKIHHKKAELSNKVSADQVISDLEKSDFLVAQIQDRQKKQNPPAPFTTSTLQQEAFNRLKFSASKTMFLAQQLYEGIDIGEEGPVGLITYMRTDSLNIAESFISKVRNFIPDKFGTEYLPEKPNRYKKKSRSQAAHEAIRPTAIERSPDTISRHLSHDQFQMYDLIYKRTLASQMNPAIYMARSVDIEAGYAVFRATGRKVVFDGYTVLYPKEDNNSLPALQEKERLELIKLTPSQHFTKPPARYTEASLVKVMEEKGIGRPSTYAPTIQILATRDYIYKQGGQLVPTELGFLVVGLLMDYFPRIMDVGFTAHVEEDLDKIEEGNIEWHKVVNDFYLPFSDQLKEAQDKMRTVKQEAIETDHICEKCGSKMVIKWGRNGRFLGCSGYPECTNSKPITTGVACPEDNCGGELVKKKNKKGKIFYGCSRYPDCRFTSSRIPQDA
ncbi:MAG: type I DNA topoisomerase [Candidatus Omnitrophica bacterium]|nr:type I DNA topoisomerase [Candidatus Omnitrophota bacterium]